MGYSQYDPATQGRADWNAGKMVGTKRPSHKNKSGQFASSSIVKGAFVTALISIWQSIVSYAAVTWPKIKIGDLVAGPEIRMHAIVVQQKTGRPAQFELTSDERASLRVWLERRGGTVDDQAFPSRINQ